VVEAYDRNSGEYIWTAVNKRRQKELQSEIQGHYKHSVHLQGNELYLLYNETPDNIDRLRKREKLKRTTVSNTNTEPLLARISPDGKISYRSTTNDRRFHINDRSAILMSDGLYMLSLKSNYSRYKVGKADLSILE